MLFRSDEGEEMCCRPPILHLRTANAQGHGLQLPLASVQRRNFSSDDHLDVWQAFDSLDQILRPRPAERLATDQERQRRGEGKSVTVRVDLGGARIITPKHTTKTS